MSEKQFYVNGTWAYTSFGGGQLFCNLHFMSWYRTTASFNLGRFLIALFDGEVPDDLVDQLNNKLHDNDFRIFSAGVLDFLSEILDEGIDQVEATLVENLGENIGNLILSAGHMWAEQKVLEKQTLPAGTVLFRRVGANGLDSSGKIVLDEAYKLVSYEVNMIPDSGNYICLSVTAYYLSESTFNSKCSPTDSWSQKGYDGEWGTPQPVAGSGGGVVRGESSGTRDVVLGVRYCYSDGTSVSTVDSNWVWAVTSADELFQRVVASGAVTQTYKENPSAGYPAIYEAKFEHYTVTQGIGQTTTAYKCLLAGVPFEKRFYCGGGDGTTPVSVIGRESPGSLPGLAAGAVLLNLAVNSGLWLKGDLRLTAGGETVTANGEPIIC